MDSSVYPNKSIQAIADQFVWIIATSAGNGATDKNGKAQHDCVDMDVIENGKKVTKKLCEKYKGLTCDQHIALSGNAFVNFASDMVVTRNGNSRNFGMPSQAIIDPRYIHLLQFVGADGDENQAEAREKAILNYHRGGFAPKQYEEYLVTAQKKMGPGVPVSYIESTKKKYLDKADELLEKGKTRDAVKQIQSALKDIEKRKLPDCGWTQSVQAKLDAICEIGNKLILEAKQLAKNGKVDEAKQILNDVAKDFYGTDTADAAKEALKELG
jgi:hypothetical protein